MPWDDPFGLLVLVLAALAVALVLVHILDPGLLFILVAVPATAALDVVSRVARRVFPWRADIATAEPPEGALRTRLSPERQRTVEQLRTSAQRIERNVALLPYEGVRLLSEPLVGQYRQLIPEVESSLHLAQWLEDQVADLETRADAPSVQEKLVHVRERAARIQGEAEEVALLLTDCEASLLATISERDESLLADLFGEFARRFHAHYEIVRDLNHA